MNFWPTCARRSSAIFQKKTTRSHGTCNFRTGCSILIRSCSRKCLLSFLPTLSSTIAARAHWLQEPESAMGGSCSRSMNQKRAFSSDTQNWGREPLRNIRQRHYGLGLNRVRAIIEAHGGELQAQYDPKAATLVSTVTLPVSSAAIRTWLNLMAFSQFKQLQPTARA